MKRAPSLVDIAATARASGPLGSCTLRAVGGGAITPELRDEMLARCAAGQHVELELEVLAYEQRAGEQNRNFVRFREGGLMAMGRSGVGTPFLRDHDQDSALARGGTVIASRTEKRAEGDYAIHQTVRLTAPWAVELALRGLLSTVSIGWNPSASVTCSLCTLNYWRGCMHMAGQRYRAVRDDAGETTYIADAAGPMVCERVYADTELVETSAVNVPAVPAAHIEAIRAALALNSGIEPHGDPDTMNPKLLALLGLAATAGDPEALRAVESVTTERDTLREQLADVNKKHTALAARFEMLEAAKAKAEEDAFVASAVKSGKLVPGSKAEASLRKWYGVDRAAAEEHIGAAPAITPVGQPRQSGSPAPADPVTGHGNAPEVIARAGGSGVDRVRRNLISMGLSPAEADKSIARHVGGVKEA